MTDSASDERAEHRRPDESGERRRPDASAADVHGSPGEEAGRERYRVARREMLLTMGATLGFGEDASGFADGVDGRSAVDDSNDEQRTSDDGGRFPRTRASRLAHADRTGFGSAVALDGATAVVGAPPDASGGATTGVVSVFAYRGGHWTRHSMLGPDVRASGGQFGTSVAVDGSTLLVGAPMPSGPTGAHAGGVTVFRRAGDDWTQEATLSPAASPGVDRFGTSVAVDGDTAVVGAPADTSEAGAATGTASVFTRSGGTWRRQATLAPAEAGIDAVGRDVGIAGDTVVAGGRLGVGAAWSDAGGACVFTRTDGDWTQEATLAPDGADRDDQFGSAVALDGDTAVVGAPAETNAAGFNAGGAYVFARVGREWRLVDELAVGTRRGDDRFGDAVALDAATAIVGAARGRSVGGAEQSSGGPAHVFTRVAGRWRRQTTLWPGGRGAPRRRSAVALDGSTALVAAGDVSSADGQGRVSVYDS